MTNWGRWGGNVVIGPLCLGEPCFDRNKDGYSSPTLVLTTETGESFNAALIAEGWFEERVTAGTYTINLTDCDFVGCAHALPKKVTVSAGGDLQLEIQIDTGIR